MLGVSRSGVRAGNVRDGAYLTDLTIPLKVLAKTLEGIAECCNSAGEIDDADMIALIHRLRFLTIELNERLENEWNRPPF